MPELPEIQAHCERLAAELVGSKLLGLRPLSFSVMKTLVPTEPTGEELDGITRRGKFFLFEFSSGTFAVHLMQAGRLILQKPRTKRMTMAEFGFEGHALSLTEAGTERKAGIWWSGVGQSGPTENLGPDADKMTVEQWADVLKTNARVHTVLRDQHLVAGLGRRLANEICFVAKISPFALASKVDPEALGSAVMDCISEDLKFEREQQEMGGVEERNNRVHGRQNQPCLRCGDIIQAVSYISRTVYYCPNCQTSGKRLADNTTSKFLK